MTLDLPGDPLSPYQPVAGVRGPRDLVVERLQDGERGLAGGEAVDVTRRAGDGILLLTPRTHLLGLQDQQTCPRGVFPPPRECLVDLGLTGPLVPHGREEARLMADVAALLPLCQALPTHHRGDALGEAPLEAAAAGLGGVCWLRHHSAHLGGTGASTGRAGT